MFMWGGGVEVGVFRYGGVQVGRGKRSKLERSNIASSKEGHGLNFNISTRYQQFWF